MRKEVRCMAAPSAMQPWIRRWLDPLIGKGRPLSLSWLLALVSVVLLVALWCSIKFLMLCVTSMITRFIRLNAWIDNIKQTTYNAINSESLIMHFYLHYMHEMNTLKSSHVCLHDLTGELLDIFGWNLVWKLCHSVLP